MEHKFVILIAIFIFHVHGTYLNGGQYVGHLESKTNPTNPATIWNPTKGTTAATTVTTAANPQLQPDTRTLNQLYQAALEELKGGGSLIVYAGGDNPRQQDYLKVAFERNFPNITVEMIVDFSKFHEARIDLQVSTNSVVADIAQLQTLQDFPIWKNQGALLPYKPIDWDLIYDQFKDVDGTYTAVLIYAFSNNINTDLLAKLSVQWPTEARDYLRPEFKNKLIMTYPNDDDAVLFLFKQIVDKYGFDYLQKLKNQNVTFVRGSDVPRNRVSANEFLATMTSAGSLIPVPGQALFVLPKYDPFTIWPQTAAILKNAPHPETAKLYMSFMVSLRIQNNPASFSVRKDVSPPQGYKSLWEYKNGNPLAFLPFDANRAAVEIFRNQISIVFGEPIGPNPNGKLGTHVITARP